jgi:hypothetical protein
MGINLNVWVGNLMAVLLHSSTTPWLTHHFVLIARGYAYNLSGWLCCVVTHSWSCPMGQIDYWTSRLPKQQTPWKTFHHGHWDIHVTLFWTQCHPNITPHVAAVRSLASTAFNISICKDQIFCLIPFYHINRIHKYIVTVVFESGYLLDISFTYYNMK